MTVVTARKSTDKRDQKVRDDQDRRMRVDGEAVTGCRGYVEGDERKCKRRERPSRGLANNEVAGTIPS